MSKTAAQGANALLFLLGWSACLVVGSSWWLLAPLGLLALHFVWLSSWQAEGKQVASIMLAGAALDSFLLQLGVIGFPGEPQLVPLWLLLCWALLGTTFNHCLAWSGRRWWLASLTGALLAPLVYLSYLSLTPMSAPLGTRRTLLTLAGCWAVLFPLLHGFAHHYRQQYLILQKRRAP